MMSASDWNTGQIAPGEEVGDIPIDVPFTGPAPEGVVYISRNASFRQGLYDATNEPWLY
jgi:hypothetical protein